MEAVERKRERAKELYRLNREQKLKYVHEYRKKNAELIAYKKRGKYLEERGAILKKQKEYYAQNVEKVSARGKVYRQVHADTIRIRNRNRKNLLRSLSKKGDVDNAYLRALLTESVICPLCGKAYSSTTEKHVDHIKPVGIGGEHKKSNIRVICRRCNLTRPKDGTDCK